MRRDSGCQIMNITLPFDKLFFFKAKREERRERKKEENKKVIFEWHNIFLKLMYHQ